jgi:hypothetical protein
MTTRSTKTWLDYYYPALMLLLLLLLLAVVVVGGGVVCPMRISGCSLMNRVVMKMLIIDTKIMSVPTQR